MVGTLLLGLHVSGTVGVSGLKKDMNQRNEASDYLIRFCGPKRRTFSHVYPAKKKTRGGPNVEAGDKNKMPTAICVYASRAGFLLGPKS